MRDPVVFLRFAPGILLSNVHHYAYSYSQLLQYIATCTVAPPKPLADRTTERNESTPGLLFATAYSL